MKAAGERRRLLSGGRVAATQWEVAGVAYGAGAARMRRDREFGAIRVGGCEPRCGGTCSSVGSGWPLLCSLGSRSRSSAGGQPAGPRARVVFVEERERWDCAEDMFDGVCVPLGPDTQRAGPAGLKHRRVQPSCPPRAKRHLFLQDRHYPAAAGGGSGRRISLP